MVRQKQIFIHVYCMYFSTTDNVATSQSIHLCYLPQCKRVLFALLDFQSAFCWGLGRIITITVVIAILVVAVIVIIGLFSFLFLK